MLPARRSGLAQAGCIFGAMLERDSIGMAPMPTEVPDYVWCRRVIRHPDAETALSATKRAIRGQPSRRFHRHTLPDGTTCFEVLEGSRVLERHVVQK